MYVSSRSSGLNYGWSESLSIQIDVSLEFLHILFVHSLSTLNNLFDFFEHEDGYFTYLRSLLTPITITLALQNIFVLQLGTLLMNILSVK